MKHCNWRGAGWGTDMGWFLMDFSSSAAPLARHGSKYGPSFPARPADTSRRKLRTPSTSFFMLRRISSAALGARMSDVVALLCAALSPSFSLFPEDATLHTVCMPQHVQPVKKVAHGRKDDSSGGNCQCTKSNSSEGVTVRSEGEKIAQRSHCSRLPRQPHQTRRGAQSAKRS